MRVKLSQLLRAMSQAADLGEAKDIGHGQRVALLALAAARAMGSFDEGSVAELAVAALLHDIGLSSVVYGLHQRVGSDSRELLAEYPNVEDGLFGDTEVETEDLRNPIARHVDVAVRMLQQLGYGVGVTEAVMASHAREDGTGYPANLSGEEVPFAAQILALADHLETATWQLDTVEERFAAAPAVLARLSGTVLQPEFVERLTPAMVDRGLWESVYFMDGVEATLDEVFENTYGVEVPFDGLEAHLRILAQFVDAQSPWTAGHTFEVTRLARRVGERIGLDPEALDRLHLAGLVHGAGRLSIPSSILEKTGGLTEDEFVLLHAYPSITREVLHVLQPLREIVDEASTHREKLDGSGYPEGRRGDQIPLIGRILGVADTYVALVSERPYRPAYSRSRALAIIQAESASLFDGLVTDALEASYREGL